MLRPNGRFGTSPATPNGTITSACEYASTYGMPAPPSEMRARAVAEPYAPRPATTGPTRTRRLGASAPKEPVFWDVPMANAES